MTHKNIVTLIGVFTLYATTSLASVPEVKVSGMTRFQFGFFNDHYTNSSNRDAQMESEIYVNARNVTPNGLEYGANVQLKASTDDNVAADEVTIWLESRWGRLEFGDQDGAADVMSYYAPKVGFGGAVDGDFGDWVDGSSSPQIGPKVLDSSDSTKVTYYTPRIEGFQFGVSYSAELDKGENIVRSSTDSLTVNPGGGLVSLNGNSAIPAVGQASNSDLIDYVQPSSYNAFFAVGGDNVPRGKANDFFQTAFEDFFELGANYVDKFDDFDINIALGYTHATQKSVLLNNAILGSLKRHPLNAYHIGAQIGWHDLKIGGSFVDNNSSGQLKRLKSQKRTAWNIGASYLLTPQWEIGVNYIHENLGGSTKGNGNYYAIGLSTSYILAPGLMVAADYVSFKRSFGANNGNNLFPGQTKSLPTTLKTGKTNDEGYVAIIGTELQF